MKIKVTLTLAVIVLFVLLAYAKLGEVTEREEFIFHPRYRIASDAFSTSDVSAHSYLVFDASTGEVLAAREADVPHEMASVAKLLTADTALAIADLEASTTISWRALETEGRSGKLQFGEEYRLRELLFPMLLSSSNDAAEAIAESYGRETFIASMNDRAKEHEMTSTVVVDPSGLSSENVTTARDLSKLLSHLYRTHRHVLDITSLTTYVGTNHAWRNSDPVITSEGFIGGKQGYTDTARKTLAAIFETRFGEDRIRPIGIVLLQSSDLVGDAKVIRDEITRAITYGVR